jgi:hypothetical protein
MSIQEVRPNQEESNDLEHQTEAACWVDVNLSCGLRKYIWVIRVAG